ncbi:MAG: response regulator transcription factor [Coprococcus sp.]|nr:response regulator transcription factor [Coprococcus sp.]
MIIRIAILEDNETHTTELIEFLNNWGNQNKHTLIIKCYSTANDIINDESVLCFKLIFSDIELVEKAIMTDEKRSVSPNGIEVCIQLRKKGFKGDIIFLTSFKEYVFDGYQVKATNFLLKPVTYETIEKCLDNYALLHQADYYYIHKDKNIIQISYNDIISISKLGHDCCIDTMSGVYAERTSLQDIEKHLPSQFVRCHKSCIINMNYVTSLSGYTIRLSNKQIQLVGRAYYDNVKSKLLEMVRNSYWHCKGDTE